MAPFDTVRIRNCRCTLRAKSRRWCEMLEYRHFKRLSVNACGDNGCCPDIWCRLTGTAGRLSNDSSYVERYLSTKRPATRSTWKPFGSHFSNRNGYHGFSLRIVFESLFNPWKADMSPAFQASRSPGVLRSQSGRISLVTVRRSCQRSMTEGRPQNQ